MGSLTIESLGLKPENRRFLSNSNTKPSLPIRQVMRDDFRKPTTQPEVRRIPVKTVADKIKVKPTPIIPHTTVAEKPKLSLERVLDMVKTTTEIVQEAKNTGVIQPKPQPIQQRQPVPQFQPKTGAKTEEKNNTAVIVAGVAIAAAIIGYAYVKSNKNKSSLSGFDYEEEYEQGQITWPQPII